jgi:hypothetical protein
MEVSHVAYSSYKEEDTKAIIVFCVMINRPCLWAPNNSEHHCDLLIAAN